MNRTALLTLSLSITLTACGGGGGSGDEQPATVSEDTSRPLLLNWIAPSTRVDQSPLDMSEISGYKIYAGPSSTNLELIAEIDDSQAESYDLSGIEPGEYYFGIVIYDIYGLHSQISNRIVKTIP
ncbi:MAG: hypothetical protein ABW101_03690 [Candidatus Thiodiazotropha sp.]